MSDPPTAKSPVSIGDIVAGKYRVERVLGSGGMGVVVAATHLELDQTVALKFILPQALSGAGSVERFMREARAAVRLKSEHVARVYDVGRDGEDRPFMVLELLEGMDLAKLSKQKGPLPVADAVEYLLQACEGLVEAHAAGIVHRDLKPQNLFVTRRLNGTALVKVLDFGIAKAIGPLAAGQLSLTDSAAIIGSPLYMAPEQMRSARTAEIRSDIWALGVILFELLGGQLPFDGETVTEVCIRVVNDKPVELLSLRPALDPALVQIVMRCLAKDPEERFHNVSALAAALEPFSRSAKQGGLVRPWRSFEDTQDSPNDARFANVADATGPATLVSVDTVIPPEVLERSAAHDKASPPLASTSSSWSASTSGRGTRDRENKPARSFSTGVVAAIVVVAAAAAAVGGLALGRGSSSGPSAATSAGTSLVTGALSSGAVAATAAPTAPTAAEPSAVSAATVTALAAAAPPSPAVAPAPTAAKTPAPAPGTAAAVAARLLSAGKIPRQSGGAHPEGVAAASTAASSAPRPPEMRPEPVSPNGAPILH